MPNGYTSDIYEGKDVSLSDYAAGCARGMGAFIHQRDSYKGTLSYPPSPDDSYYHKSLAEAIEALRSWRDSTEEEKYARWSDYYNEATVKMHNVLKEKAEMRARYEGMLAQVHAVEVPSRLQSFKDFMIENLESSMKFDCGGEDFAKSYYQPVEYVHWCDNQHESAAWSLNYCTEQVEKEKKRYEENVSYIDLMVETFGIEVRREDSGS